MPLLTQHVQDEDEQYCLVASLDNVRNLSTVLKAIHFKEHAACFATKNGLKVTVENAKCVQANAFIQAEVFQEFIIQEESVTFRINLTILLDCLSIFGSSPTPGTLTALRMCYQGYGHPLMLFLEEGGVVTVCKINTQEPEETLDFDFCSTNVMNKIILQSEGLREAFSELDMTSDVLQITVSPDKPHFRLSTFGNAGSSHLDYPKDSDLMEAFHCNKTQVNSVCHQEGRILWKRTRPWISCGGCLNPGLEWKIEGLDTVLFSSILMKSRRSAYLRPSLKASRAGEHAHSCQVGLLCP
ncbi:cell cycle checkpoint protein RAD1 isoform X1 [Peromyscus californicus insignis]|uniref:cell cycle checkpoint protein RAD1 isoform X1 n=1 Tax=Peromyscus californicus insignis TaxID=564181 RepID=UPI0022A715FB|nr:cell cycle checkpoint protein RAD1 isoform X1 [Peromyscus californicus insignis]